VLNRGDSTNNDEKAKWKCKVDAKYTEKKREKKNGRSKCKKLSINDDEIGIMMSSHHTVVTTYFFARSITILKEEDITFVYVIRCRT
jgi:hypothetical protein